MCDKLFSSFLDDLLLLVRAVGVTRIYTSKRRSLFPYRRFRSSYPHTLSVWLLLENRTLVEELANAPAEIAKQINLYAMMRYNRLVREFMMTVIGEKFRNQDFSFSRRDLNTFFTRLQEQNDDVASWSEQTVNKIKGVLVKSLVEAGHLDSFKAEMLNPVFICEELENGIRANGDYEALPAFNCFR